MAKSATGSNLSRSDKPKSSSPPDVLAKALTRFPYVGAQLGRTGLSLDIGVIRALAAQALDDSVEFGLFDAHGDLSEVHCMSV